MIINTDGNGNSYIDVNPDHGIFPPDSLIGVGPLNGGRPPLKPERLKRRIDQLLESYK